MQAISMDEICSGCHTLAFDPRSACCIVVCSGGYPGTYERGRKITGIDAATQMGGENEEVMLFHAGTTIEAGTLVTDGGRVLGITALACDLLSARDLANRAAHLVRFEGAFYRHDIGDRVLR